MWSSSSGGHSTEQSLISWDSVTFEGQHLKWKLERTQRRTVSEDPESLWRCCSEGMKTSERHSNCYIQLAQQVKARVGSFEVVGLIPARAGLSGRRGGAVSPPRSFWEMEAGGYEKMNHQQLNFYWSVRMGQSFKGFVSHQSRKKPLCYPLMSFMKAAHEVIFQSAFICWFANCQQKSCDATFQTEEV